MPTIPELKQLAKDNNVKIPSRANKGDIEEALRKAGVPFEASKPRKAPSPKPAAATSSTTSVARKPGALAELILIQEDRTATTYYVPFTEIKDFNKLKAQIKLPFDQREVDEDIGADYIEQLATEKARHTIEGDDGFEPTGDEYIAFSAVVRMYI